MRAFAMTYVFPLTGALAVFAASPLNAADPRFASDEARLRLEGTVQAVQADAFVLDYSYGTILVEMDDADRFDEASLIKEGDVVAVAGRMDADLFEERKLEASSVYSYTTDEFFHASADDEETRYTFFEGRQPLPNGTRVGAYGHIRHIEPTFFIMTMKHREILVNVSQLIKSTENRDGPPALQPGQDVMVIGTLSTSSSDHQRLQAEEVAKVVDLSVVNSTFVER